MSLLLPKQHVGNTYQLTFNIIMARFTTEAGIDDLTGKFSKHSRLVMRKKEWHYPDGRVFGCGPKEVYEYEPRDYKRDPRTPAEQAQYER